MTDELIACELTVAGQSRTFSMRPPRDPDAPLVLVLHGNQPGVAGRIMHEWTSFAAHGHTWPSTSVPPEWVNSPDADNTREFDAAVKIYRFARPLLAPADARKL